MEAKPEAHIHALGQALVVQSKRGKKDYISKWVHDHDWETHRDIWPELVEAYGY